MRFPLSFLVMIITPAKDELFGVAVVFGAVDVTEYATWGRSILICDKRINSIPIIQDKKINRFQL